MKDYTSHTELADTALSHRAEVDEVKRQISIRHGYFDAWIYSFLVNKKFNIEETVAKLERRFAMELTDLATSAHTEFMREWLRKGVIQEIGVDKQGRTAFFINTLRDFPESKNRDQRRRIFDMYVSYGTRLRAETKRCEMVIILNQKDISMSKNMDMTFQKDMALRGSKFYPGGISKMYMCSMGMILTAACRSLFKTASSIVSESVQIVSSAEVDSGALLELFDEDVLPVAMGGKNECDNSSNWESTAERIEAYFFGLQHALKERNLSVKEYELELLGIDPIAANEPPPVPLDSPAPHTPECSLGGTSRSMMALQRTITHWQLESTSLSQRHSRMHSLLELHTMRTCLSECDYANDYLADSMLSNWPVPDEDVSWENVVKSFAKPVALQLLDDLMHSRITTEEKEMAEWYMLMNSFVRDQQKVAEKREAGISGSKKQGLLRSLYQFIFSKPCAGPAPRSSLSSAH